MDDGRAEVDGLLGGAWSVADQNGSALDDVDDGDDEEHLKPVLTGFSHILPNYEHDSH